MSRSGVEPSGQLPAPSVPEELDAACDDAAHSAVPLRFASVRDADFQRAAGIFRALADEPRLRILEQLSHGELCVTELAAASGDGLSTVSQRLRVLRRESLVTRRRDGKHIFYSLADEHVANLVLNALEHATEDK